MISTAEGRPPKCTPAEQPCELFPRLADSIGGAAQATAPGSGETVPCLNRGCEASWGPSEASANQAPDPRVGGVQVNDRESVRKTAAAVAKELPFADRCRFVRPDRSRRPDRLRAPDEERPRSLLGGGLGRLRGRAGAKTRAARCHCGRRATFSAKWRPVPRP